jgi:hypothetical protein
VGSSRLGFRRLSRYAVTSSGPSGGHGQGRRPHPRPGRTRVRLGEDEEQRGAAGRLQEPGHDLSRRFVAQVCIVDAQKQSASAARPPDEEGREGVEEALADVGGGENRGSDTQAVGQGRGERGEQRGLITDAGAQVCQGRPARRRKF